MKFWEKNFLYTLALFSALIFICVFIINSSSVSAALSSEREAALREEYVLSVSLQRDISELNEGGERSFPSRIAEYGQLYKRKAIYLSLQKGSALLYTNLPFIPSLVAGSKDRVCKTVSDRGSKYIFIEDTLGTGDDMFTLVYLKDISALYAAFDARTYTLLAIGAAACSVFAFALYFTLKKIYRPIGSLAHELRTPLTIIRGYAEYIEAAAATKEERYSATRYIIDESKRLSDICEKLLIMANLREGDIPMDSVDIKELFENVKSAYKNVDYDIKKHFVKGNKTLLQSMVNNLVSNSTKASTPGETVLLKSHDNIIEVCDKGKGMSAALLSRLAKHGGLLSENYTGGLGLPLCFNIARLHGAKLEFESAPGEGTTARVTFTSS